MTRPAFLDQEPPPGYIAGIGRGAVGFTTAADSLGIAQRRDKVSVKEDNLLDDEEEVYKAIELQLARPAPATAMEVVPERAAAEFSQLKKDLEKVSAAEWEALPEAADFTRRNKRQRIEEQMSRRTYAAPDSLIGGSFVERSAMESKQAPPVPSTDYDTMTLARNQLLSNRLDQLIVNTREATTSENITVNDIDDTVTANRAHGDLEKLRELMATLRKTQPKSSRLWIMLAQLEADHNQLAQAQKIILEGTRHIPRDPDLWIEAIRVHRNLPRLLLVISEALAKVPHNLKLWEEACSLERGQERKLLLMKGIENMPLSVLLWTQLFDEIPTDQHPKFLVKAVELCPQEWSFWQRLVELQSYPDAKKLLNKARKQMRKHADKVWLAAMKLEEKEGNAVSKLAPKALQAIPERDWMSLAKQAEEDNLPHTAKALVRAILEKGSHESSSLIASLTKGSHPFLVRAYYDYMTETSPLDVSNWVKLFALVKDDLPTLFEYYHRAIKFNPERLGLRLMLAKDQWILGGDVEAARRTLATATALDSNQQAVLYKARIKLEVRLGHEEEALKLGRESLQVDSPKVWYRFVHLLRAAGKPCTETIQEGLKHHPSPQLYLQKAQCFVEIADLEAARATATEGAKRYNSCTSLWILWSSLEEQLGVTIKARSVLDEALVHLPSDDRLWVQKIELERRHNLIAARQLVSRALKVIPQSPRLWMIQLLMIAKMSQRKNMMLEALRATNNDPIVLLGIGRMFLAENKVDKAKQWVQRAAEGCHTNGDIWATQYRLILSLGSDLDVFMRNFEKNYDNIIEGDRWNQVKKNPQRLFCSPKEILVQVLKALDE